MADRGADVSRYEKLAAELMAVPDPVRAIASLVGDHEARLDRMAERIHHLECRERDRRLTNEPRQIRPTADQR